MTTVQQLSSFLQAFFPRRSRDVAFQYHVPFKRRHLPSGTSSTPEPEPEDLSQLSVSHVIFSITPTQGVYSAINRRQRVPPVIFLHRPFNLERRRVRKGSTVLSSHVGFDEVLTVGFNVVLAQRLGVKIDSGTSIVEEIPPAPKEIDEQMQSQVQDSGNISDGPTLDIVCLKGYKDDLERRIGLAGALPEVAASQVLELIRNEFGQPGIFGFGVDDDYSIVLQQSNRDDLQTLLELLSTLNQTPNPEPVSCLAIMNAFHPAEVDRVIAAARKYNFTTSPNGIVYLTGAPRVAGLEYALQHQLRVVCVGHQLCEEWGIRYLAAETRKTFPHLHVEEIYEDEEPLPPRPRQENTHGTHE